MADITSILPQEDKVKESSLSVPRQENFFNTPKLSFDLPFPEQTKKDETPPKVSPSIEGPLAEAAGATSIEDAQNNERNKIVEHRSLAIRNLAYTVPTKPDQFKDVTSEIINAPLPLKTNGEAIAEGIRTTHSKEETNATARRLDEVIGKNLHVTGITNTLEGTSYNEVMNRPDKDAVVVAKHISRHNSKALKKVEANEETYSLNGFMETLDFINPIGDESPKGMDIDGWQLVKDVISGDFEYNEFDKKMESNYGKEWESRWGSWLAKEVGIDAALLALAAVIPLTAPLIIAKNSTRIAKLSAAIGRAVVVGVGGTAVQIPQSAALNRELDIPMELAIRTGGFLGAEGLGRLIAKGASVTGRGISKLTGKTKRDAIAAAAKDANVKPVSKESLDKILNKHEFDGSPSSAFTLGSLRDKVKNYNKFIGDTAQKILSRKELELQGMGQAVRNDLSDLLGMERGAIDNIEIDMLLPDITKMGNRFDKWAKETPPFTNQGILSQGLSTRLYAGMRGQFENGTKDFELYLGDAGLALRRYEEGIAKSGETMLGKVLKASRVGEPVALAFQSASNYLTARNFTNRVANGLRLMYENSIKGLNKKELATLDDVLKQGNLDHMVYQPGLTGSPIDMSPKVYQAYVKMRFALDMGYEILDKAKVNSLKGSIGDIKYGKVFKTKDGFVQIASKNAMKDGSWQARKFNNDTLSSVGEKEIDRILPSQLEEITTIVPYRNGHIPRVYNPHKYSVVAINPGKGQVNREALFDSSKEAAEYVKVRNSDELKSPDEIVIQMSENVETGFGGFRMGRQDMNLLDSLSGGEHKALSELLSAKGVSPGNVRLVLDTLGPRTMPGGHHNPLTDLGTAVSKEGKQLRQDLARAYAAGKKEGSNTIKGIKKAIKKDLELNTVPTRDAIVDYFGTVAHSAGYDNWRVFAIDDFIKRYGDILQRGSNYNNLKFDELSPKYSYALEQQAKRYGKWLERNITQKTWLEKRVDRAVAQWSRQLGERAAQPKGSANYSLAANVMAKIADNTPLVNNVYGTLRFIAASPKLLTLNIPQLAIQASQAVITVSTAIAKNPAAASRAVFKLPMMGMIHATKSFGKDVPTIFKKTDTYKAYEDLVRSGYASDLYTTDTLFGMRNNMDPSIGRKIWEGTKLVGAAPFRGGEAINRVTAFLAVREQTISAIKSAARKVKGQDPRTVLSKEHIQDIMGFDGKLMTKADIGSHQFREAVVDKAQVLALNMAKSGQLELMSGPGSVLLQFKQVLPKQLSLFDSSRLSVREKFAGAGGLITFWGVGGIPLAADVLNLADLTTYKVRGSDPSERFYVSDHLNAVVEMVANSTDAATDGDISAVFTKTLIKRGSVAAFSDDEINIISRVALGSFMTDMVDINSPFDFVVSFAVLNDMIDAVDRVAGSSNVGIGQGAAVIGGAALGKKGAIGGAVIGGALSGLLNPISFMEILGRMQNGENFNSAVAKQYEPESAIGKYLAGETTIRSTALEILRQGGRVYSQFGSWSRIADATNRDVVNPDAHWRNPLAPKTYLSSTMRGIPVEQNDFRDWQLKLGFTPGKVIEAYNEQDLQRTYNNALKNYKKKISDDYRHSFGDYERQKRIREDAAHTLYRFKSHMESLGLEHNVPSRIYKSLIEQWFAIEGHAFTGGKMK